MNYLQAYRVFTEPTEPSQAFHLWCAIHNLSALLGRKCYINQGHFIIFPHLYIMLVGEPASRKSTAISIARKMITPLGKIPTAPSSSSRSSLIDTILENRVEYQLEGRTVFYHQAAAYADEFGEFIGGRHLNQDNVRFITKIWTDDIYEERTRAHGHKKIPYPYLTILGGCQPGWLSDNLHHAVISEGFARRMLFVVVDEDTMENINAWPTLSKAQIQAQKIIVRENRRIVNISGDFALTTKALEHYIDWYTTNKQAIKSQNNILRFYFSSKHELVLKVCMCISASITNKRIVDYNMLRFVLKALAQLEKGTEKALSGISQNPLKGLGDRIESEVAKHGRHGIANRALFSKVWDQFGGRMLQYKELIESLLVAGKITETKKLQLDSDPVYVSTAKATPLQEVDLFAEVCRLELDLEDSDVTREPVLAQHLVDPTVVLHEATPKPKVGEVPSGILLRGKRPVSPPAIGDEPNSSAG
jgi:hypothetical protein